jgi:hypothetical protein
VTVPLASAADNGEVDVSGPQTAGYPPTAAPIVYTGATLTAGRRLAYGSYGIYEPLLRFNTAGLLPQGATITSATLKLYLNRWTSADKRNLVAEWLPTATWPLAAADWALTSSANALAPVPLSSLTGNAVNSFTLTGLENITTGGYTTIRLEVDGGQPAGDNYAQFASYQAATSKPQLILDYTTP